MKYNYICLFGSWFHFLSIYSYFEYAKNVSSIILIKNSSFIINEFIDYKLLNRFSKKIIILKNLDELKIYLAKNKNHGYMTVITPDIFPYKIIKILKKFNIKFNLLISEEGLGFYSSRIRHLLIGAREYSLSKENSYIKNYILYTVKYIFMSLYCARFEKKYWSILDRKNMVVRDVVLMTYRATVLRFSKIFRYPVPALKKIVIFASSPFVELNYISEEDYINIVHKLRSSVKECDIFIVKPHPIEDVKKFHNFSVIDKNIPVELYVACAKCEINEVIVYSFSTTSVYTLNFLFQIKSKRIYKYDFFYGKMSKKQKQIIDANCVKFLYGEDT